MVATFLPSEVVESLYTVMEAAGLEVASLTLEPIAALNAERLRHMELRASLTPAVLAYEGIQYQYMAPAVFEESQYEYIQKHLRILSGFMES